MSAETKSGGYAKIMDQAEVVRSGQSADGQKPDSFDRASYYGGPGRPASSLNLPVSIQNIYRFRKSLGEVGAQSGVDESLEDDLPSYKPDVNNPPIASRVDRISLSSLEEDCWVELRGLIQDANGNNGALKPIAITIQESAISYLSQSRSYELPDYIAAVISQLADCGSDWRNYVDQCLDIKSLVLAAAQVMGIKDRLLYSLHLTDGGYTKIGQEILSQARDKSKAEINANKDYLNIIEEINRLKTEAERSATNLDEIGEKKLIEISEILHGSPSELQLKRLSKILDSIEGQPDLLREALRLCAQKTLSLYHLNLSEERGGSIGGILEKSQKEDLADKIMMAASKDALEVYRDLWRNMAYAFMKTPKGMALVDTAAERLLRGAKGQGNRTAILSELGPGAGFGAARFLRRYAKDLGIVGYEAIEGSVDAANEALKNVQSVREDVSTILEDQIVVLNGDFKRNLNFIEDRVQEEIEQGVVRPRIMFSFSTLHYNTLNEFKSLLRRIYKIVKQTGGAFALIIKHTDQQAIDDVEMRRVNGVGVRFAIDVKNRICRMGITDKALGNIFREISDGDADIVHRTTKSVSDYDESGESNFNIFVVESNSRPFCGVEG